ASAYSKVNRPRLWDCLREGVGKVSPGQSITSPPAGEHETANGDGPDQSQDSHQQQREKPGRRSGPTYDEAYHRARGHRGPKGSECSRERARISERAT